MVSIVRKVVRPRRAKGSLAVEFVCGCFLASVFVALGLHLGIAIFGAYANDRACRDACRNAAQGQDLTEATKLANVILKSYQASGFLSAPKMSAPIVYQDFAGRAPAQTSPYVQVSTSTDVLMPLGTLSFFNAGTLQDSKLSFVKTYTFPIVRVK
ncbi:MAG: hypothetical protein C0508_07340 [Cyanobacteria bacterium PR.023]|jgi:hypothetical protein|nr:hypothetical protein [Cyanobacteria bacterium PR.023]MDQ5935561.1 hypothetical protein [Cyanobacteriota bacterium erpe_2018_sw_21hr_WHONDRS-SW48-000092_B_bin.40]